jgi:aspartate oxidase
VGDAPKSTITIVLANAALAQAENSCQITPFDTVVAFQATNAALVDRKEEFVQFHPTNNTVWPRYVE